VPHGPLAFVPRYRPTLAARRLAGEVLQKWMLSNPVRVRETLPVVRGGNLLLVLPTTDGVVTETEEAIIRPREEGCSHHL
jgi:hypothetical protein